MWAKCGREVRSKFGDEIFNNGTLDTFALGEIGGDGRGGGGGHWRRGVEFCCGRH